MMFNAGVKKRKGKEICLSLYNCTRLYFVVLEGEGLSRQCLHCNDHNEAKKKSFTGLKIESLFRVTHPSTLTSSEALLSDEDLL